MTLFVLINLPTISVVISLSFSFFSLSLPFKLDPIALYRRQIDLELPLTSLTPAFFFLRGRNVALVYCDTTSFGVIRVILFYFIIIEMANGDFISF